MLYLYPPGNSGRQKVNTMICLDVGSSTGKRNSVKFGHVGRCRRSFKRSRTYRVRNHITSHLCVVYGGRRASWRARQEIEEGV